MKNFEYFGVMIDCSRNAVPNVTGLKKFFDIISRMGYNCAMLYTEDTYEVENEPYFGYKRGKYSAAELRELDDYAASVGIELIPCIQTLAHLNAIFRWDEYRRILDINDILSVDLERSYELIENMFSSISKNIRSRKLHIGMDEAHNVGLGKYLDRNGFGNRFEILINHLKRVCDIAKKYGYEVLMWEDMFFRLPLKGTYYTKNDVDFPKEVTENMPENCTMVYWDYYSTDTELVDNMIKQSYKLSPNVWWAGGAWVWGGFAPHCRFSKKRNEVAIAALREHGVKNAFVTMWGDCGGECPYFSALGMLMHAAALAEDIPEDEMRLRFKQITGESYDAFCDLELPNYVYGKDENIGTANYSKNRLYDDPFLGILSTNTKGIDGSVYADYEALLKKHGEESSEFGYLFETLSRLCGCMKIKFSLYDRTYALYKADDKEGLRKLANEDYTEFLANLEAFYTAFRAQWYKVNKTYGFEIQDVRLGGLMQRIKSCRARLIDYANGDIDEIAELCEEALYFPDGNVPEWYRAVSANVI